MTDQSNTVDLICGALYFKHVGADVCPAAERTEIILPADEYDALIGERKLTGSRSSVAASSGGGSTDSNGVRGKGTIFRRRRPRTLISDECNQLCIGVCMAVSGECVGTSSKKVNCICKMEQS